MAAAGLHHLKAFAKPWTESKSVYYTVTVRASFCWTVCWPNDIGLISLLSHYAIAVLLSGLMPLAPWQAVVQPVTRLVTSDYITGSNFAATGSWQPLARN